MQELQDRHERGVIASKVSRPVLGDRGGMVIAPGRDIIYVPDSPIVRDMNTIWDTGRFNTVREPVAVRGLRLRALFSRAGAACCTDMPVKFPGTPYRLPAEQIQFAETLRACADFEAAANPRAADYYAYLTIDQQYVKKGASLRGKGLHSDSIQGPRIEPKTEIEHTYFASDRDATECYVQPFDMAGYDTATHWFNAVFERQARPETARRLPPYTIGLIDAYCVHGAVDAEADGPRTFFRLIYSVRRFDRLGNTHNNLFDYAWKMEPRPVPAGLAFLRR